MIAESDGRRADGPDCDAACPNFVHLYILVVNKSLSVEVPCWPLLATLRYRTNNVTTQMSKTTSRTTTADNDASMVATRGKFYVGLHAQKLSFIGMRYKRVNDIETFPIFLLNDPQMAEHTAWHWCRMWFSRPCQQYACFKQYKGTFKI